MFVVTLLLFVAAAILILLERTGTKELLFMATVFSFVMVGGLVASRRPRNTIGWILLAIGFAWGLGEFLDGYDTWSGPAHPGMLPGATVFNSFSTALWVPAVGLLGTFAILLFPDGHLPSRGWRFLARTSAAALLVTYVGIVLSPGPVAFGRSGRTILNPLAIQVVGPITRALQPIILLIPVCIVGCAWALIRRFRRSTGVERLQLKWLATAASIVASLYLVTMVASINSDWGPHAPAWIGALQNLASLSFCLVAVAIGIAVLRYRLYDIDLVINKTLVYGSLAAFISAVYVAIVVGIGALLGREGHPDLALSIAATVVVAIGFQPVRERVQRLANRLVYGKRATPYEVLSRFSDRLGAVYATDDLPARMAQVLADGVGASRADVWLRIDDVLFHEGTWPADGPLAGPIAAPPGELPDFPGASRVVAIRQRDEMLGALVVTKPVGEPLSHVEDALLDDLAGQAGLMLRNVRLMEELRASRRRIVAARDEERRRLERDIHDGAQQQLITLSIAAASVRSGMGDGLERSAQLLTDAIGELRTALQEIRELAQGIHPSILTDQGLAAAIETIADRSPVPVSVSVAGDGTDGRDRPPPHVEAAAYFAVSEALANVAKYARATRAEVSVERSNGTLSIRVSDDGVGGADPGAGSGLRGLIDRVSAIGGELEVDSPAGLGTTIRVMLPCASS
jgi:signal transduction histidine kinase